MRPELQKRIEQLASDRASGASEILAEALAILREALLDPGDLADVSRALPLAQPSMGSMWNAAQAALAGPDAFAVFSQRVARAPVAVARFAVELFATAATDRPLRLVTISYSRTVLNVLVTLARVRAVRMACSEGRPALEGRTIATGLAESGVDVTIFTDAAIAHALRDADAVVVGADAVGPDFFVNKSGTRMLAAAATLQGVPFYVLASRDKFVGGDTASRLQLREGLPSEIWDDAPSRITVRNPYFETTPLDLVAGLVTDIGVLGPADAPKMTG
jgi:translation initiation factor 2B subunit (eIF-2B alpha/beta/delta family)